MFESILIPTDGSKNTEKVVDQATSLCTAESGEIHSLYVIDHRALIPLGEDEQESVAETLEEKGEAALETVTETVEEADAELDVSSMVAHGIPARQILAYAEEKAIDAIILGSHGQTMQKQAIGSTTERVVRGVNEISDTTLVIIPIGPETGQPAEREDITEQAKDMFQ